MKEKEWVTTEKCETKKKKLTAMCDPEYDSGNEKGH